VKNGSNQVSAAQTVLRVSGVITALALPLLGTNGDESVTLDLHPVFGQQPVPAAQARLAGEGCAGREELRFEMLSPEEDPHVRPPRRAGVCLAVHRHLD